MDLKKDHLRRSNCRSSRSTPAIFALTLPAIWTTRPSPDAARLSTRRRLRAARAKYWRAKAKSSPSPVTMRLPNADMAVCIRPWIAGRQAWMPRAAALTPATVDRSAARKSAEVAPAVLAASTAALPAAAPRLTISTEGQRRARARAAARPMPSEPPTKTKLPPRTFRSCMIRLLLCRCPASPGAGTSFVEVGLAPLVVNQHDLATGNSTVQYGTVE